ncbi:phosphomannose isomerase type II C-terminal cupin domain [Patescibacteria group bacterium]|nr:phosphomannose isomerase type II C-terminal cupin domain [Patescibacteria group bacterium]
MKVIEEERPWGNFRQFTHNSSSTVKIITVKPLEKLSLQSHTKRTEFWRVIKGSGVIEIDEKKMSVIEGDEKTIPLGSKHRIEASENGISVLEISTGEFDENDITRYEDKYGRV